MLMQMFPQLSVLKCNMNEQHVIMITEKKQELSFTEIVIQLPTCTHCKGTFNSGAVQIHVNVHLLLHLGTDFLGKNELSWPTSDSLLNHEMAAA